MLARKAEGGRVLARGRGSHGHGDHSQRSPRTKDRLGDFPRDVTGPKSFCNCPLAGLKVGQFGGLSGCEYRFDFLIKLVMAKEPLKGCTG